MAFLRYLAAPSTKPVLDFCSGVAFSKKRPLVIGVLYGKGRANYPKGADSLEFVRSVRKQSSLICLE